MNEISTRYILSQQLKYIQELECSNYLGKHWKTSFFVILVK